MVVPRQTSSPMATEMDSLVPNRLGGSNHFGRLRSRADGLAYCP